MRNPVNRAYSFYLQLIKNYQRATGTYQISRTFEECIFPDNYPSRAGRDKFFAHFDAYLADEPGTFLEAGKYYTQITQYLKYFEMDQMLFLMFDKLINYPDQVLKDVCKFLAIDPGFNFVREGKVTMNVSKDHFKGTKKMQLIEFLNKIGFMRQFGRYFSEEIKRRFVDTVASTHLIQNRYDSAPCEMLPSTRSYLTDYYYSEIRSVEKLLEMDLSVWIAR